MFIINIYVIVIRLLGRLCFLDLPSVQLCIFVRELLAEAGVFRVIEAGILIISCSSLFVSALTAEETTVEVYKDVVARAYAVAVSADLHLDSAFRGDDNLFPDRLPDVVRVLVNQEQLVVLYRRCMTTFRCFLIVRSSITSSNLPVPWPMAYVRAYDYEHRSRPHVPTRAPRHAPVPLPEGSPLAQPCPSPPPPCAASTRPPRHVVSSQRPARNRPKTRLPPGSARPRCTRIRSRSASTSLN